MWKTGVNRKSVNIINADNLTIRMLNILWHIFRNEQEKNQSNDKISEKGQSNRWSSLLNNLPCCSERKEVLGQYSDILKMLSTYHEECCELVDADNQKDQAIWFDDLDQHVFDFKQKIRNWLKESDNNLSRPSSRGSSRSKKSSGSTKSSVAPNHQHSWNCLKRRLK